MSYPPPEPPQPPGYQPVPPVQPPAFEPVPPPSAPPASAPPAFPPPAFSPPPASPFPSVYDAPVTPAAPVAPPPVEAAPPVEEVPPPKKVKKKRPIGWIITVTLLSLALIGAGVVFYLAYVRLQEALTLIEQQQEMIDEKETFSSAMGELLGTAAKFEGYKVGTLVDSTEFDVFASRAYAQRHNPSAVAKITRDVEAKTEALEAKLTAAQEQAATNASGTVYESVIDSLGAGFVTTAIDDADSLCDSDVLGCVTSDNPLVVHIDAADVSLPYMTEFIQQGVAYHEFAHVLQQTNVAATEDAVAAFSGDLETMADCFALTYLDGWTLHHKVPISSYEWYEVDIGYGYTCDESQMQVVRDWYDGLGYVVPEVGQ